MFRRYVSPFFLAFGTMGGMNPRRPKGSWYLPGRRYDLASAGIFRGLRRRIAAAVERDGLYPWLDVCCGTGSQIRGHVPVVRVPDPVGSQPRGHVPVVRFADPVGSQLRGHVPEVRVPDFVPDHVACGLDKSYGFVRYAAARAPGVPFVCGDAGRLPFKDGSFRAVSVSFGLHDKSRDLRRAMMAEARRVLAPSGRFVAVDFENPWSLKSKVGALAVRIVERLAGSEHYRNGRDFLSRGGLRAF
ncbi:MAG: methyltransferase domain-containing protein, partial [Candidatus Aminicenantes bacterium]|nr:methyltransferase domain-containing protein [Candidatus Aminicenantes bacterium]